MSRPTILKIGGSLLDLPDLVERIQRDTASRPAHAFVVGGAAIADSVRAYAKRFVIEDVIAHEIALRAMHVNESLVAHLLNLPLVGSVATLNSIWESGSSAVIHAEQMLQEPEVPQVPATWDSTSDSIAAAIALGLGADLVLLKSASLAWDAEQDCGWERLVAADMVDRNFPCFARRLHVEWVNLRDE